MVNREDFAQIEYELVEELGARRQINDSSIHKIIEHNGEARYVVSVPYTIREDDEEVFIQYNGLDSLSEDAKTELDEDIPTVIGYHSIQSPEIEVQANVSIDWSSVDMYPVDEGEVTVHSGDDSTNSIEISNLPGDDDCVCHKQVATDCAPSLSCLADIAGAFALATGACGACYLDPEPVTKGLACSAGIGTILTQYDSPSCLGREDTTNRCIPETHPDSDVICG
ncbi:hypothetical protein [Haloarcula amylovorans]|uniref:hypothetical protein n=1 Tax=Haloarcula amylovorans TaxID=2562280 RepID=UPI0010766418|nr:hypothetical protein [Halomicroarcula amylolytica]